MIPSIYESTPIKMEIIKKAIEMKSHGKKIREIFIELKLQRSCMLHWMHQYSLGRKW